jgi:hypothetical protein
MAGETSPRSSTHQTRKGKVSPPLNWTVKPGEEASRPKPNPSMNTMWEKLETHLQHLLLDYVNGAMNPVAFLVMKWLLRRNSAARRRVVVIRHLLDVTNEQPLHQPSHTVLQRIRSRINNQPQPHPTERIALNWADRSVQVMLAILTLLIIWRTNR